MGAGSLLSYFRVTGGIQEVTRRQLEDNPDLKRWPWFVEGRNNSVNFGKARWLHNIRRQHALESENDQIWHILWHIIFFV